MRAALSCLGVWWFVVGIVSAIPGPVEAQADAFRGLLAPHGTWVSVAGHGQAFVPREAEDESFVPYLSGGRWEARDAGLAFVSIYAWGEVCFHQGRWLRTEETRTWVWLPGRAHASAWVTWRRRGREMAWRALGPNDGPSDLRPGASSWSVAPRDALGSALLATHALRVGDAAVAAFVDDAAVDPSRERGDEVPSPQVATPRVGRDQVMLSGGGHIVVHGPEGDRVLSTPPVVVSRATAEARLREQAQRDEARRERETADRETRARLAAEQRDRDTLAAAERASRAAETATQAALTATQAAQTSTTTRTVPVFPYGGYAGYGGYGYGYGYGTTASIGRSGSYPYGGRFESRAPRVVATPAPAPVTPAPATPRAPPIVGSSRGIRPR